jgi:hypothetical protein
MSQANDTSNNGQPVADVLKELQGGKGAFVGSPFVVPLEEAGYEEREYEASGTATSYGARDGLTSDGRWSLVPEVSAPYRTRVLVRIPTDPERFSGTAVVEWINVSGGVDADVEWISLHEEILRRGHAWVGVSAQRIGVMGGPVLVEGPDVPERGVAGKGLRGIDPARYAILDHPGDGFAFDIFTQVGRAVASGDVLSGVRPQRVIAAGESQSAIAMVTYYNGVQRLAGVFDGFFVHSRGAFGLPLVGPGEHADIAGSLSSDTSVVFRTDLPTPVMDVQAEADVIGVLNSYAARQPDHDWFRLWEVAGTAHADVHLLGPAADALDCGLPINDGPMHLVVKAAFRALETWLTDGATPASVSRLEVEEGPVPTMRRDDDGIALGGVRTPPVDVPVATLSGEPGPSLSMLCLLLGSTKFFSSERLGTLYPSRAAYLERYGKCADETIAAGFVLPEDRDALLGFADPSGMPG